MTKGRHAPTAGNMVNGMKTKQCRKSGHQGQQQPERAPEIAA